MFKYFPHTENDIKEMLKKIGISSIDELFSEIPQDVIYKKEFDLPNSLSEIELRNKFGEVSGKNKKFVSFLGAGSYDVYTPSVISALTSRQEFLTAYTPYQPEIAQGTLQYIFEFQSMICELNNMDVANASVYDGATATAEALFMATSQTKRNKVLVSKTVNPRVLDVVKTYAHFRDVEIIEVEEENYVTSINDLDNKLNDQVAAIIIQNPNFFGVVEKYDELVQKVKANKSLVIMNVDPSTLSLLKTPGEIGVDIACGDGQTLGIPLSFGGPYVGFVTTTEKLLRKMPGRICGMTNDLDGKRGFVLTLQAREQHIRREKANSNICSNQSLMALHTVIYMSLMGKQGLKEIAKRAFNNAHYLEEKLLATGLFVKTNHQPFFKEFVLEAKIDIAKLNEYLLTQGYLFGYDLMQVNSKYQNQLLICATEMRSKEEIDDLVKKVEGLKNVR